MRSAGLSALIDDGAIVSVEAQAHLADLHEGCSWSVDLTEARFTFGDPAPATYPVQVIGTAASASRSWCWGWANPAGLPQPVVKASLAAREVGERYKIPELVAGQWPFGSGEQDDEAGCRLALDLTTAAIAASGTWFGYSGQVSEQTRVWMLLGGITLPVPTVARTTRAISEALSSYTISDHRRAVTSYAALRRLPFDGAEFALADGRLALTFDDAGRINGMKGSAGRG